MAEPRPNVPIPDRAALARLRGDCVHRAANSGQADLYAMTGDWEGWLLKDVSGRPLPWRLLFLRRSLRREHEALSANASLEGLPEAAAERVDADAFLLRRLEARPLPRSGKDGAPGVDFFERLEAIVKALHGRGWAHGDLRRKNILIDEARGWPWLIDFGTAFHAPAGSGPMRRRLFEHWRRTDLVMLAKIKRSYLGEAGLSEAERRRLAEIPWYLRVGRFLRKKVYRPLKPRHRRETLARLTRLGRGGRS